MTPLGDTGTRVAIVGLGDADAHAAGYLLANANPELRVDVFQVPRDTTRRDLRSRYDVVVYETREAPHRPPPIPGADLAGVGTAQAFLAWQHGDARPCEDTFDLHCRRAIVVGNGGRALEVAVSLTLGREAAAEAGPAEHAATAAQHSGIEEVVVLDPEGPEQANFDDRQLRALTERTSAVVVADPAEVAIPAPYRETAPSETARRTLALLTQLAAARRTSERPRIALRFLLSPTRIVGDGRVQAVELARTTLERDAGGRLRARETSARTMVPAGLVIFAGDEPTDLVSAAVSDAPPPALADARGRVCDGDGRPTGEYVSRSVLKTVRVVLEDLADDSASVLSPASR